MKRLIVLTSIIVLISSVKAQWIKTINASSITGADTLLKGYNIQPSDVSAYNFRACIFTQKTDTIQISIGGIVGNSKFMSLSNSIFPYTITPANSMVIEGSDTTYQTCFTSRTFGHYGFKTPMVNITKLNATGQIRIYFEFFK